MKSAQLEIKGMTCNHCVKSVRTALEQVEGVTVEDVKIGSAQIWYHEDRVDDIKIEKAIAESGYQLATMSES